VIGSFITNWSPLAISLWVSSIAGFSALVLGVGLAWYLARTRNRFTVVLEGLTLLSLVLPPTILGYYLLVALGRQGLGTWIEQMFGIRVVFAWPGAVVVATIVAMPLVIQTAKTGFAEIEREIEDAARVDGCGRWQFFWRVGVPVAWRGIAAGGMLGFLRALGEFGATLMVAGNIPGRTQTLAMAIFDAVQKNDFTTANRIALLLLSISFGVILLVYFTNQRIASRE
jgi:molybdate transport system permease protein